MRRIIFLLLLMCSVSTWAQDVIVKRDGTAIVCRIVNVSSLEIVYKKWTDLQGPNLVMSIADAASITYENGEKKVFSTSAALSETRLSINPIEQSINDNELLRLDKNKHVTPPKVRALRYTGYIGGALIVGGGIAFACIDDDYTLPGLLIAGGGAIWATSFLLVARHQMKKKSELTVQSMPLYQRDICFRNGTSLGTSVNMLKDNARHNPTLGIGLTYNF